MYLIVGCGLSGAVLAERIANILKKKVIIIDKLDHIGGLCYDYIDETTGILCNKYGPHLFHTNNEEVWNYINKFSKWIRWELNLRANIDNKLIPLPINISSVNLLCNENISTETEMQEWLNNNQIKKDEINNSEDIALSRVGNEIYEKILKNYTFKQWNKYPNELDKEVLGRINIRNNFDNRYFTDKYQVLPEKGYTEFIKNMLDNPLITIILNMPFETFKLNNNIDNFEGIIYTGPIDAYFSNTNLEKLEYRSIEFIQEIHKDTNYYQQYPLITYPSYKYPFTRITEYKHMLNQQSKHTIIFKEISNDKGHPFYPVPTKRNKELYEKYKNYADKEKNVYFVGRLANYKYFNMDEAIYNSLELFKNNFAIEKIANESVQ